MDHNSEFAELPRVLTSDAVMLTHPSESERRRVVVIFHGMTGTPSEMAHLARHLYDNGFHVLVPRLSGHGTTVAELGRTNLRSWYADSLSILSKAREFSALPVNVVGLSFGALLAWRLAVQNPAAIAALVLAAPPLRFASRGSYQQLNSFSLLPEWMLSYLWTVTKRRRRKGYLRYPHSAYGDHSVGALARLLKLRRTLLSGEVRLSTPVLVVQDPFDHHLEFTSALECTDRFFSGNVSVKLLAAAEHEIFIGNQCDQAAVAVEQFFNHVSPAYAP